VTNLPRRLEEASRLGFTRVVVPASSPAGPPGVELIRVETVKDAFLQQLGQRPLPERGEWRSEDPGDWIDEDGQLL
jgi:hypothetical protein